MRRTESNKSGLSVGRNESFFPFLERLRTTAHDRKAAQKQHRNTPEMPRLSRRDIPSIGSSEWRKRQSRSCDHLNSALNQAPPDIIHFNQRLPPIRRRFTKQNVFCNSGRSK